MDAFKCMLFLISGTSFFVFTYADYNSPCYPERCHSKTYPTCIILKKGNSLSGTCHITGHNYHDCPRVHYHISEGSGCYCLHSSCLNAMLYANTHHYTPFQCLSHQCFDGNKWCHIYRHRGNAEITSGCVPSKPSNGIPCVDHATAMNTDGCYCDTSQCVEKTALHALGTSCTADKEIEFYKEFGSYHARCQSIAHGKARCEFSSILHLLGNSLDYLPCACNTQSCAYMMTDLIQEASLATTDATTTTRASTTTATTRTTKLATTTSTVPITTTTQTQTYASCVYESCDTFEPYCHLFFNDLKPDGSCKHFKVGQECTSKVQDLYSGGCYCETTQCVLDEIQAFYKQQTTEMPTTAFNQHTTEIPTTTLNQQTTDKPTTVSAFCVHEQCNDIKKYCNLFLTNMKPDGSCKDYKVGQQCTSKAQDLLLNGCYCETTQCVFDEVSAFYNEHTTAMPTTASNPTTTKSPPTTTETTAVPTPSLETTTWMFIPHVQETSTGPAAASVAQTSVSPTLETSVVTSDSPAMALTFSQVTQTMSTVSTKVNQPTTFLMTSPTTRTPTTIVTQTVRSCNLCGDKDLSIPCSNREIIMDLQGTCNSGEVYCMTDVYHDAYGQIDVYKRCVDKQTCETEWIGQSADLDYCKKYGVIKNPSAFQCHFCCVSDGCNTNKMPNSTSLFTKA